MNHKKLNKQVFGCKRTEKKSRKDQERQNRGNWKTLRNDNNDCELKDMVRIYK